METSRGKNIREAIEKYGPITDRFILRLGKSDEEAGKFEPWHVGPNDQKTDLEAFLACLNLTRLVDSVEERMKTQKGTIRAVKKEQREIAKALKKEQEKLQKAMDKAAFKVAKEAEKVRIKEEAKANREALKAAKKAGVQCTSTEKATVEPQSQMSLTPCTRLVTTTHATSTTTEDTTSITSLKSSPLITTKNTQPEGSTTLTAGTETMTNTKHGPGFYEETESYVPTFNIPMEG